MRVRVRVRVREKERVKPMCVICVVQEVGGERLRANFLGRGKCEQTLAKPGSGGWVSFFRTL